MFQSGTQERLIIFWFNVNMIMASNIQIYNYLSFYVHFNQIQNDKNDIQNWVSDGEYLF
jgi:hypothetical protein